MDELEKKKKFDEQQLGGKELYELKRKQKEESKKQEQRKEAPKRSAEKIGKYFLYTVIGLGGLAE